VSHAFEPFSADLTAVTMGIDAFERKQTRGSGLLDEEGLVPIYLGADLLEARVFRGWDEVEADLAALNAAAAALPAGPRRLFAHALLRSLEAAVCLFSGGELSYAEKIVRLVGAPAGPVAAGEIAASQAALDRLLSHIGFVRGTLTQRIHAWEAERALPAARLAATFTQLMAEGKARTAERIFATGEFTMALNPVRDVPYTARCGFAQRRMDLNVDLAFTRAALKHLVAHEVYPGHATQLLLTRARVLAGEAHPETLLCTANTVLGCVQEGIADEGVALLDWFEDDDDHIHYELRRLRSAAQTSAAWYLMVEGRPRETVAEYLRETAAGQEPWVQGRLRMAAHPFRGPFIASYWVGAAAVRRVFARVSPSDYPRFVEYLYGQAHSPESLELFAAQAA